MSEVKFYWADCPEFEALTEKVVLAADLDRVTAERDAALGLSVENILMEVGPGWDGRGEDCYATSVAEVVDKLGAYADQVEDLQEKLTCASRDYALMYERLTAERDAQKEYADRADSVIAQLQQRLTAADERAGELLIMLRMAWVDTEVSAENCRRIDAALKPAEGGGDVG